MIKNIRVLIAASPLLVLSLTACAPPSTPIPEGSDMTPEEVKAQIVDLYQASVAATAPDGWESQGMWAGCTMTDGVKRARWNFSATRNAALPSSPEYIVNQAQKAWEARGHDVEVEQDTNLAPARYILSDPPYLTGTHADGSYSQLTVGENFVYFDATSACVPGNIGELNAPGPASTPTP